MSKKRDEKRIIVAAGAVERPAQRIESAAGGLLRLLAERVAAVTGATTIFGAPVERAGVTVIPVATARWGFGAGGGTRTGDGEGGAAVGSTTPVGFIELRDGGAEFRPIRLQPPLWAIALVMLAGSVNGVMVLRSVRRLLRG
jgi:hypothetical protein